MLTELTSIQELRKEAEVHNTHLDIIFNSLPQSLALVTPNYEILRVNQNFLSLYGVTNDDVLGRKCYEACFGRHQVCEGCLVEKALVSKKTEKKIKSFPTGEICEMTAQPVLNEHGEVTHVLDMRTNITELVEKEREVRRIRFAMDQSTDEFWLFNKDWKVIYASSSAAKNLGYTVPELMNMHIERFNLVHRMENLSILFSQLKKKKNLRIESIQYKKNGSTYPCEMNLSYFSDNEEYVYAVVRDITKRRKYENELIESRERAERASKMKTTFLANMSHEIRTPMNAIIGFSNFVLEEELDETTKAELKQEIKNNSNYLLSIISDIIEISKIESGNRTPDPTTFETSTLLLAISKELQPECPAQVSLELNLPELAQTTLVNTDKGMVRILVQHLLRNAFKFTRKGHIELGCRTDEKHNELYVYVKDSGIGIAPEHLDELFEPFHQLNPMINGTGIGLTICKGLAQIVGTNIFVESELGRGSEFGFVLKRTAPNTVS